MKLISHLRKGTCKLPIFIFIQLRNHLLEPENYMVPESPDKDGDKQRMNDKIRE
jgi:hypothetical protein